jgi:predicted glycoside hydrolase/deacetylase ChbG (UPF0249 family)
VSRVAGEGPLPSPERAGPNPRPRRRLALCVDDFGAAPGIADAVEQLAARGRVQAVSCLVGGASWGRDAVRLAHLAKDVDVGLHLALTEGRPLAPALARLWRRRPSLGSLLLRAHAHALPRAALRAELEAQLATFADATGAPPRFVDGHQHVHHLPVVRELLLEVLARVEPRPALRNTGCIAGPRFAFKRAVIERSGGRALEATLARRGWPTNAALTGVYDFRAADYGACMRGWLAALPDRTLLFCHPSAAAGGRDRDDPIGSARAREFAYLASEEFVADLEAGGVVLTPVWAPLSRTTTPG